MDRKDWLVLKYAQESAWLAGDQPRGDYMAELSAACTPDELACLNKLVRMQGFANHFMNWRAARKAAKSRPGPAGLDR